MGAGGEGDECRGEPAGVRRAALLVSAIAAFTVPFMSAAINIALPPIGGEFGLGAVSLGWVATSFILASAVCLVPFGRAADIWGRKRIFIGGVAVFTLGTVLCPLSACGAHLIAFRAVQGIGSAMLFGTAIAILTAAYPPGERGTALGINVASTYLGLSLGPVLGGVITHNLGWRWIFYLNIPLGIILFIVALLWLSGDMAGSGRGRLDWTGAFVYGASLVALIFGFASLPAPFGAACLIAGIAGITGFYLWELRAPQPVLNVRLLRGNAVFKYSNIAALINYSATFATGFLLSLYLQNAKGMDPQGAGLVLLSQPAMMCIVSPFAGRLSDRAEPRTVASAGMAISAAGLLLLALITATTPLWQIAAALILLGVGFGLFSSPNTNAVMGSVEKKDLGVASATIGTMRQVGQMLSLGMATMLFSLYIGGAAVTAANLGDFVSGVRVAFLIFGILCGFGVLASLARGTVGSGGRRGESRRKAG